MEEPNNSTLNKEKKSYKVNCKLSYEEAYAAFFQLADKFGKRVRIILGAALTMATIFLLYMQYITPGAAFYSLLAVFAIILLYRIIYSPHLKARKGARNVVAMGGILKFEIFSEGYIKTNDGGKVIINGDKDSRVIETDELFILRPDRTNTFCIPKIILNDSEIGGVRGIFEAEVRRYYSR